MQNLRPTQSPLPTFSLYWCRSLRISRSESNRLKPCIESAYSIYDVCSLYRIQQCKCLGMGLWTKSLNGPSGPQFQASWSFGLWTNIDFVPLASVLFLLYSYSVMQGWIKSCLPGALDHVECLKKTVLRFSDWARQTVSECPILNDRQFQILLEKIFTPIWMYSCVGACKPVYIYKGLLCQHTIYLCKGLSCLFT